MQFPINKMYFISIPADNDYTIPDKSDRRCRECELFDVENNKCKIGYTSMCDCHMKKKCIFTTPLDESMFEDD